MKRNPNAKSKPHASAAAVLSAGVLMTSGASAQAPKPHLPFRGSRLLRPKSRPPA